VSIRWPLPYALAWTNGGGCGQLRLAQFRRLLKEHVIDRSKTRVLADLNIVGAGMRGAKYEDNLDDMDGQATAKMALKYPGVIVGIKSAHFTGPEWKPYEQAVDRGQHANIPS